MTDDKNSRKGARRSASKAEQVYARIYRDIQRSNFEQGVRLQPIRSLAATYDCSYVTVQKAIKLLQQEGILVARRGRGIFTVGRKGQTHAKKRTLTLARLELRRDHHAIGIVLPYWIQKHGDRAIHEIFRGIMSACDENDWRVDPVYSQGEESIQPDFIDKIMARNIDGVVWLQPIPEHKMNVMRLLDQGMQVVTTGRRLSHIPVENISVDYSSMGRKIAGYCLKEGRENILILCGSIQGFSADPYSVDIVDALVKSLATRNISIPQANILQMVGHKNPGVWRQEFEARHRCADAIISLRYDLKGIIQELDEEGFWQNPEDILFFDTAADFFENHRIGRLKLVKVRYPLENVGRMAVRAMEKVWLGQAVQPVLNLGVRLDLCM